MSCICQKCGRKYKVDILIDDNLWEKIKPKGKPKGAGLLCGVCIFEGIEKLNKYDMYRLDKKKKEQRITTNLRGNPIDEPTNWPDRLELYRDSGGKPAELHEPKAEVKVCEWIDIDSEVWKTSCGNTIYQTMEGLSLSEMEYCVKCGKKIKEVAK